MRPLIGIPCHAGFREGSGRPIYCNNRVYIHAIEHAGGVPILIPVLNDLSMFETLLPRLDGLLLPGGLDINPSRYGEEPHPFLGDLTLELDEMELTMTRWALDEDLPTIGICRGIQLLNVALGGTLYQDLPSQYPGSLRHMNLNLPRNQVVHKVYVDAGSRMEQVLGTREFMANSLHHQAIKEPGKGVLISGRSEDGVAELLEAPDYRFVMAMQCHPEEIYLQEPVCARFFAAFVKACGMDATEPEENIVSATAP
jgi:putative glutamine amidotransferase